MFDTQLAGMLRQDKAKLESARRVASIFKFSARAITSRQTRLGAF